MPWTLAVSPVKGWAEARRKVRVQPLPFAITTIRPVVPKVVCGSCVSSFQSKRRSSERTTWT